MSPLLHAQFFLPPVSRDPALAVLQLAPTLCWQHQVAAPVPRGPLVPPCRFKSLVPFYHLWIITALGFIALAIFNPAIVWWRGPGTIWSFLGGGGGPGLCARAFAVGFCFFLLVLFIFKSNLI